MLRNWIKPDLNIGDLVKLNESYPYKWIQEEARLNHGYYVTEISFSANYGWYVQLHGVYSSYPAEAVIRVTSEDIK